MVDDNTVKAVNIEEVRPPQSEQMIDMAAVARVAMLVAVHCESAWACYRRPALCGVQDGTGLSCSLSNVIIDQLKKA